MPRAKPTLEFRKPSLSESWLGELCRIIRLGYEQLVGIVNGRISFGDGDLPDNIDGVWVEATTPTPADTNFTVVHNLGRLPVGYIVVKKSAACDVYDGSVAATETEMTLKATVAGVTVLLFTL